MHIAIWPYMYRCIHMTHAALYVDFSAYWEHSENCHA